jgi:hypothetical protein
LKPAEKFWMEHPLGSTSIDFWNQELHDFANRETHPASCAGTNKGRKIYTPFSDALKADKRI